MPDSFQDARAIAVRRSLERLQRGYRLRAILDAIILGAAAAGLVYGVALATSRATRGVAVGAVAIGFIASAMAAAFWWIAWTLARTATAAERRWPHFENLVITAQEAFAGRRVHPVLAGELYAQAASRLEGVDSSPWAGSHARGALACGALSVTALLIGFGGPFASAIHPHVIDAGPETLSRQTGSVRVTVAPPAYSGRQPWTLADPVQVEVLEGSTVRVELADHEPLQFVASTSRAVVIGDRLVHVQVHPDERPIVAIERPGRDLLFGTPSGAVPVLITAHDDLRLAEVTLRYTRIAGSGETFTFEEGDIPLAATGSPDGTSRRAGGSIVLDRLELEDGDTLVYRAVARDDKPGADPSVSESFLIEIGKRAEASAGGFAVPEDRDRQALSQQMLIMKTERLHAERHKLSAGAVLERSRLLAVEQRMVRAEFLFMTGGEVVDEIEEAEHSDELAQGRFENEGQVELLNAIREMSRAEARLNAAETTEALVYERAALRALQRAFDRRRYFLRTLSERARIDLTRRLSGDLSKARSSTRAAASRTDDPAATAIRQVMLDLAAAARKRSGLDAHLAARIIALDPRSTELQQTAIRLSSAGAVEDRVAAAQSAQVHLQVLLRKHVAAASPERVSRDPLLGLLADQLPRSGAPR